MRYQVSHCLPGTGTWERRTGKLNANETLEMVEAGGVGIFRSIENMQLIDFSRRSRRKKTVKLRLTGTYLEREISLFAKQSFGYRVTLVAELATIRPEPHLSFLKTPYRTMNGTRPVIQLIEPDKNQDNGSLVQPRESTLALYLRKRCYFPQRGGSRATYTLPLQFKPQGKD
jgi:hypothetical protein